MTATLADIELVLYTALDTLDAGPPTTTQPFAVVGRFAGEVPQEGLGEVCAQYPAALLRFDDEASARDVIGFGAASIEDRTVASFTVLVAVEDPRSIDDGMIGDANVPGALRCVEAVIAACNGLTFTDAHQRLSTRYAGTRPVLIRRGTVYVYGVRFEAQRDAPTATSAEATAAAALTTVNPVVGDVNLEGTGTAPNPLVQFRATPNP